MIRLLGMSFTELWMFGVAVTCGLVELAALLWPGRLPVITRIMRADGTLWTIWPFIYGLIGGHLWSPRWFKFAAVQRAQPWALPALVVAVFLFDIAVRRTTVEAAFLVFLGAALVGSVLWNTA